MISFREFFLGRDRLGHPFSLNYRGSETHQTWLGAALSMIINILVLVILAQKIDELINMTDPEVQVFTRPIFQDEVEEAGETIFSSHKMNFGLAFKRGDVGSEIYEPVTEFIESIGINNDLENTRESVPFVSCEGQFSGVDGLTEDQQKLIEVGSCIDADKALLKGTKTFNDEGKLGFEIELHIGNRIGNEDIEKYYEYLHIFYTSNIYDFEDPD